MNLKLLKEIYLISEDHEKKMSKDEMVTYLELLYKKCTKGNKDKFNEYLASKCDMDAKDVDFKKCSKHLCDNADKCDEIIHHLEGLSEKLDENSVMYILSTKNSREPENEA